MESDQQEPTPDLITECVQKFWDEHRRPMLLSSLGTALSAPTMHEVKTAAGNLANYVRTRLSGSVSVVQHSMSPSIIAALPSSEAHVTQDWDHLLSSPDRHIAASRRRFDRVFWTAFRKPLPDSSVRYLSIDNPLRFTDIAPGSAPPPGSVEIPRAYIPGDEAMDPDVAGHIDNWLRDNDLDETRFLYAPQPPPHRVERRLPTDDLFGRLIVALNADELDTVTMPTAIAAKLRRTPI